MNANDSNDDLREIVRDVLRELLPETFGHSASSSNVPSFDGHSEPISMPPGNIEVVNLRSDAELRDFVSRLLRMFENVKAREDLRSGRIRFRLTESSVPGSFQSVHRVDFGAVTEATVKSAANSGAKLVLGPGAVLTPLARDRARSAGVLIERDSK